jgi:hypothetical protein
MAAARLSQLKQLVSEALWTWLAERDKHTGPADPVHEGPPWPYVSGDKIAARVTRELGTPEKSRKHLVRRLKRFRYPYGTMAKLHKSFYVHVRGLGILNFLLSNSFLDNVRSAWFFLRHYELDKELFDQGKSQDGFPLVFHRDILRELSKHWERIVKIAQKHQVPEEQFTEYLTAIRNQLLIHASSFYPELQLRYKRASKVTPHSFAVEKRLEIYDAIQAEFSRKNIRNDELAYQLTALICSGTQSIANGLLDLAPDAVRLSVTHRMKQTSKI